MSQPSERDTRVRIIKAKVHLTVLAIYQDNFMSGRPTLLCLAISPPIPIHVASEFILFRASPGKDSLRITGTFHGGKVKSTRRTLSVCPADYFLKIAIDGQENAIEHTDSAFESFGVNDDEAWRPQTRPRAILSRS